jgi:hypothetical protein
MTLKCTSDETWSPSLSEPIPLQAPSARDVGGGRREKTQKVKKTRMIRTMDSIRRKWKHQQWYPYSSLPPPPKLLLRTVVLVYANISIPTSVSVNIFAFHSRQQQPVSAATPALPDQIQPPLLPISPQLLVQEVELLRARQLQMQREILELRAEQQKRERSFHRELAALRTELEALRGGEPLCFFFFFLFLSRMIILLACVFVFAVLDSLSLFLSFCVCVCVA